MKSFDLTSISRYIWTALVYSIEFGCVFLIRASLVFVLFAAFDIKDSGSFAIYSIYAIVIYTTTILGSYISSKLLPQRISWLLGFALSSTGCIICALTIGKNLNIFYLGLAFVTVGGGVMKCNSLMITNNHINNYMPKDQHYDCSNMIHTVLVVFMFISLSFGGIIKKFSNNSSVFLVALCILISGAFVFIYSEKREIKKEIKDLLLNKSFDLFKKFKLFASLFIVIGGAFLLFKNHYLTFIKHLPLIIFFIFYSYLLQRAYKNKEERKYIYFSMFYSLIAIFYLSLEKQLDTVLALFANRNVDRIIMGYEIPALNINSLFPVFVFFIGLVFFKYKTNSRLDNNKIIYCIIGSLIFTFSFLILGCFSASSNGTVGIIFYILALFSMAVGDVFNYAKLLGNGGKMPPSLKGIISSCMMLNIAFGFYFSRVYSSLSVIDKNISDKIYTLSVYKNSFSIILGITVIFFIFIFIILQTKIKNVLNFEKETI